MRNIDGLPLMSTFPGGSNLPPFGVLDDAQPTQPHRPGLLRLFNIGFCYEERKQYFFFKPLY